MKNGGETTGHVKRPRWPLSAWSLFGYQIVGKGLFPRNATQEDITLDLMPGFVLDGYVDQPDCRARSVASYHMMRPTVGGSVDPSKPAIRPQPPWPSPAPTNRS
jgi:hypothetical protein